MTAKITNSKQSLPSGVIFNAYPDSIGRTLSGTMQLLANPQVEGAFSLFYVLPTFFNSDLDRGFSIIDYDTNGELVAEADLQKADDLGIGFKEINRTTLSLADIENGLQTAAVRDQLKLLKLRNTHPAFSGNLEITETEPNRLHLAWRNGPACAILEAGLRGHGFTVSYSDSAGNYSVMRFAR